MSSGTSDVGVVAGKTVLVTGGTGSFGTALINRLIHSSVREIRILSRDEKKQDDLRREWNNNKLRFYIGDVRNPNSIDLAMKGVDYVFSAAALKQVPSCEFHPLEAVYTNILGTENTLATAIRNGVRGVVVLSTDKAVQPVNAMGMTKAVMEKVAVARSRNLEPEETTICVTRYGNVMASRGSVIPLFIQQILAGQPITVTDPEMTRFMMTLDDSVDLVLFAFENAMGGDTFVQKAPAATIEQLARILCGMFGAKTNVRIIGPRHGEKKHETLVSSEEMVHADDLGNYFRIRPDTRDLNYAAYFEGDGKPLREVDDYTSKNTKQLTDAELERLLLRVGYVREALATKERVRR